MISDQLGEGILINIPTGRHQQEVAIFNKNYPLFSHLWIHEKLDIRLPFEPSLALKNPKTQPR